MPNSRRPTGSSSQSSLFDDETPTVPNNGIRRQRRAAAVPTAPVRRNPRRAERSLLQTVLMPAILILLACAGSYAGYAYRTSHALRSYLPDMMNGDSVATAFPGVSSMNLMVIGRDYDYDNSDQIIKTNARSDMLMVAKVDFAGRTVQLLSIPRDTEAIIPGHDPTKINAAHAYGGPTLAAETIRLNFGIPVDHYVALDFDGFKQAIDLLGGVNCLVDKKMDYDDNWGHLHIHLLPGYQHLDGEEAMDFVRFRHSDSDLVRIRRQQTLLAELKRKLVQPSTLAVLPSLLDTIDKHVDSDLTDEQKFALAKFLHALPQQSVTMVTMPSYDTAQYVETDYPRAAPVVKQIFGVDMPQQVAGLSDHPRRHRSRFRHRHITLT